MQCITMRETRVSDANSVTCLGILGVRIALKQVRCQLSGLNFLGWDDRIWASDADRMEKWSMGSRGRNSPVPPAIQAIL